MDFTIIGCGDAFGNGGRLQTSFYIAADGRNILLDCGASTLIGLAREGIAPGAIDVVVLSHLHGDHYTGLVWLLLHEQHPGRREKPLTIIGPPGTEDRLTQTRELLFPGSTARPLRFDVRYEEFQAGPEATIDGIKLQAFTGSHPSGSLSAALRLGIDDKCIAFSGDTEWVEDLVPCAADADLFLSECYAPTQGIRYHLNWETLIENIDRLTAKQIVFTHMNADMLQAAKTLSHPRVRFAEDGMRIVL